MIRLLAIMLLFAAPAFAAPAFAAPKVALVVAVGQYRAVATLANPPRDAQLVGAALRSAGFAVTPLVDPDRGALVAALAAFRQRAVGAEAAIIYFAGHGVEVEGANLLLPIDVLAGSPDEVKLSAINARQLASAVGPATRLRLVVLDACRDNPFAAAAGSTRSLGTSRGLAREAISGVVTILATQAGQRAEDRSKLAPNNSPFARAFAEVVGQAGLEVVRLPTRLARAMAAGDGIAQQPDQIGIWLDDEYRFQPVLASVVDTKPPAVVARPVLPQATVPDAGVRIPRDPVAGIPLPRIPSALVKDGGVFRDCSVCPEMVGIPAGKFMMGSPADEPGRLPQEGPQHAVTVARFAAGRFEVTNDEWDACVAGGGCSARPTLAYSRNGRQPVVGVTWDEAQAYVNWLRNMTRWRYRLLSEAEWEYAARAGTQTAFSTGNLITAAQANVSTTQTTSVGSFPANAFRLHDMHGNAFEWVNDCWHTSYAGAPTDGSTWDSVGCSVRVHRGGSFGRPFNELRSAFRTTSSASARVSGYGFRVARSLD